MSRQTTGSAPTHAPLTGTVAASRPAAPGSGSTRQPLSAASPNALAAPAAEPTERGSGITYYPGLDGIRAISVLAVLLYHGGISWAHGGYLGVEVFFVISGYLITSLLLSERRSTGKIDLGRFWLRRARRLLPAMFAVVLATLLVTTLFFRDELASLRGDAVASLLYVNNWNAIVAEKSYFEAVGRPPMLQHLWSLAVEEQFYVVWPLLFAGGMALLGRRRFVQVLAVGAAASAVWMLILFDPTLDSARNRVYLGTDTRASGLLIGCLLAFFWSADRIRKERAGPHAGIVLDAAGAAALLGILVMLAVTSEFSTFLYPYGFVLLSLLTAVLIASVVHPSSHLGPLLGSRPLRWIGLRSYGIYLWHWPIFQLTRPDLDVPFDGFALFALRMALTFGVAALSYRYLEQPIRHGALGRSWKQLRSATGVERQALQQRWLVSGAALSLVLVVLIGFAVAAKPSTSAYELAATGGDGSAAIDPRSMDPDASDPNAVADPFADQVTSTTAPPATAGTDPDGTADPSGTSAGTEAETTVPEVTASTESTLPRLAPHLPDRKIALLGDSVMLGASPSLKTTLGENAAVSAAQNRQVSDGIGILRTWKSAGWLSQAEVVIHLGNNGTFFPEQFDEIMEILADSPRVVFLTVRVPRPWEESVNETIRSGVARHPDNTVLIDWHAQTDGQGDWFYDGMHLVPSAAPYYAELVASAL